MPELPEVETILQSLKSTLEGRCIASIRVNRPDLRKPFPPGLATIPLQQPIIGLRRRAKYILIDFEHGWTMLIHLGMSGRLFIDSPETTPPLRKHEHLVLITDTQERVALVDPRRFGLVTLLRTREETQNPLLAHLGIEPLSSSFTPTALLQAMSATRSPIKNALLDQRYIVGLGNIYVCEALFQAKIHPTRAANSLTQKEAILLTTAIINILQQAIAAGGSTLRDYVHTDGRPGAFQNLHHVYGRAGEPCPTCTKKGRDSLIQKITQSGRSTFFCPHCQKKVDKKTVIRGKDKENT